MVTKRGIKRKGVRRMRKKGCRRGKRVVGGRERIFSIKVCVCRVRRRARGGEQEGEMK
jgi:hypothetical protein